MRRALIAAALVCLWAAAALAVQPARAAEVQVIEQKQIAPRVIELTISTPAFATPTHVHVDLPVRYAADPNRRWPVAYALAGTMNTYKTFNNFVDGVGLTKDFPAIVVSPNGDSGYWSDWYNGGAFGPPMYETYVVEQLVPLIDARFRTAASRAQRAVMGISMGGFGAMMIAARHPDLFGAAASLSGAVDSNQPTIATAVTLSPTFQEAAPDSIFGPRATQEVRWRGHNPVDLADNLRGMALQVRSANGTLNPGIGENPLSADTVSCLVEAGVYGASLSFNSTLDRLGIPHLWKDYGAGCHTVPNFEREIADTLRGFAAEFADPAPAPSSFDYRSIEPAFGVWGWRVATDPERALEFLQMKTVSRDGLTLTGSGTTTLTTPPLFRRAQRVELTNALPRIAIPDASGRIRFTVDLGPPDTIQQFTPGADPAEVSRTVTFTAHPRRAGKANRKACGTTKRPSGVRGGYCKLG